MNWSLFILIVLATYRLAEVISIDTITEPLRLEIGKRAAGNKIWKFFANLLNCPYCVGIWIAIPGALIMRPTSLTFFIIYWLSLAGGQAFLEGATKER
jgi:hypothetical protein